MTDNERQNEQDKDQVEDLEVDEKDASAVKGGRMSDPCEGGE